VIVAPALPDTVVAPHAALALHPHELR
jgi:hypothetical protein